MFVHIEWMWGCTRCCTPPQNAANYRLPTLRPHGSKLGHYWYQWIIQSDIYGLFDNSEKGDMFGHCRWMWWWSRGCTPPQEYCRLSSTYFWATWHLTRAFLISVNNNKCFFWLVWQFWKKRYVWALKVYVGIFPRLHSASGVLPTTVYLLLGHMAPN